MVTQIGFIAGLDGRSVLEQRYWGGMVIAGVLWSKIKSFAGEVFMKEYIRTLDDCAQYDQIETLLADYHKTARNFFWFGNDGWYWTYNYINDVSHPVYRQMIKTLDRYVGRHGRHTVYGKIMKESQEVYKTRLKEGADYVSLVIADLLLLEKDGVEEAKHMRKALIVRDAVENSSKEKYDEVLDIVESEMQDMSIKYRTDIYTDLKTLTPNLNQTQMMRVLKIVKPLLEERYNEFKAIYEIHNHLLPDQTKDYFNLKKLNTNPKK